MKSVDSTRDDDELEENLVPVLVCDYRRHSGATDEDTTHRVLTLSIPCIDQRRSPLKGRMKPAMPVNGTTHEVLILTCIARMQMDEDRRIRSELGFHLPCKSVTDSVKDPET
jgi:hypothetical protein